MTDLFARRKKIALILLGIWGANLLLPSLAYALTSGPAQPETQSFQSASVSDMVNLQSGDLKYNIPLLDIDGYPVSLNYDGHTGIDDEASWVGLGWNLNTGAITRQVRGLPDDFAGDIVETDHYVKPKITIGGKLTGKVEAFGISSGSLTFGIFNDNYTGLGAELGVNAGISFSTPNDGFLTAGLGVGVLSNTQSGVDASFSPYVSLGVRELTDNKVTVNAGLSGSFGYNTRSGLKALTLGTSFALAKHSDDYKKNASATYDVSGSSITYNTEPISPSITVPYTSDFSSFSFDVGGEIEGTSVLFGGTGYKNVRSVASIYNTKPAFGFLYAERGKNNQDAVMDFIRENENPVIPELPNIAIPIPTPDIWSFTSQAGSGQFRLYRGGSGAFFDNQATDGSTTSTLGGDLGLGAWVHVGVTQYKQHATSTTRKWTNGNNYLPNGDFQSPNYTNPKAQHAYFKEVGEKGLEDQDMDRQLGGTQALEVAIQDTTAAHALRNAGNLIGTPAINVDSAIKKTQRRPNRTVITYLTAAEASQAGLSKTIPVYAFKDSTSITALVANQIPTNLSRFDPPIVDSTYIHKLQHISEITVTGDDGKRMVYGVPVYNVYQDEYTFAINPSTRDANNLVSVPTGITSPTGDPNGIDNYYHKEHKPSYATSYLLSAILSPDYVDRTGDGVTDDDLGTAIKFNYSKLPYYYKWRTPYQKAIPNRGLLADPDDDKGSIIYGKKEIWYIQSIESKTKIAYFITENRRDAAGVAGWQNGNIDITNTQKCLQEIRLYSKSDMTKPIKVIKFQYTYELCRGVPNSLDYGTTNPALGGKLTLTRVWFEYGNSDKGKYHPYVFQYNESTARYNGSNAPVYGYNMTDRWGTYKRASENTNLLSNEQYPYTNQDTSYTNENSALWHLSQVTLPTGGIISISYEAGDYAYVQNQKAMAMSKIESLIVSPSSTDDTTRALNMIKGIRLNIGTVLQPSAGVNQTTWFENNFLNGSAYIYTKLCVNMATSNYTPANPITYDFVPTYCQVQSVSISAGKANILLVPISADGVWNPMSVSAWQRLKNEYPRYAYPGFDNRVQTNNNSVLAAVTAVVNAARNMSELKQGFYQKANSRAYAAKVLLGNSFVKLAVSSGHKIGGPARVKKIRINDTWNTTGSSNVASYYGQSYTYTKVVNGQTISSGVATYEPSVGNDENALKQPVPYIENIKGAINNYFDLEMPFCESLYPAPEITYSKVTVNDLDQTGNSSTQTGYSVNEFYTSNDFPVKVTALPVIRYNPKPSSTYSLTRSNSNDELCLSQGYSIELNDMDGKPKTNTIYDSAGAVISSTTYIYNTQTDKNGNTSLNNNVNVINPATLQETTEVLGRDIDFFTDFREQKSSNTGQAINIGGDVFPIFPFLPFFALPHIPVHDDNDIKLFRSACAIKVIQDYGILSKIIKTENGSTVTTRNIAFDGLTGDPLVTSTTNEFQKPIYQVNIPAYWIYSGMGAAYQNLGVLFSGFATNANGEITNYSSYLHGGDEIFDTGSGNHYWVIYNQATSGSGNTDKLIDRNGNIVAGYHTTALVKVVRSGFRNMLTQNTTTLVSLNSPFTADNHLQLISAGDLTSMKVINASATSYDESWAPCNSCVSQNPTSNLVTDTSRDFSVSTASTVSWLSLNDYYSDSSQYVHSAYWGGNGSNAGRLGIFGFWPTEALTHTYNPDDYFGFDAVVTFPISKVYYFVMAGVDTCSFNVDCDNQNEVFKSVDGAQWYIAVGKQISAGKHIVHCSFKLKTTISTKTAGLEIYNNTFDQLINADSAGTGLNIIFSTKSFIGNNHLYDFFDQDGYSLTDRYNGYQTYHFTKTNGSPPFYNFSYCGTPTPVIVNPYIMGYLGNWRPYQTKVFQQSRNYTFAGNMVTPGIDIKNAGYLNSFYSYWYLNTGTSTWTTNPNTTRWVIANTVTLYDKYGQQLENMDALGRFSAANFDFNGELPSAVASNAMNREIYAASLEDSHFIPGGSANVDTCNNREFTELSTGLTIKRLADSTIAHSGNYSAKIPADGITLTTIIDTVHQKTVPYLVLDAQKQYNTKTITGTYPNGFEPYPGKKYIYNAWIYDGYPNDKTVRIALSINGNNVPLKCKAVVEGWKLVEGTMDLSTLGTATTLAVSVSPLSGTINIDDIRMYPFDAQMKTYAYDDKTMRLMAEIDENGFATFYEYDDEGLLVRVKKETEKGIMTLKETRSTYRRNTKP